MKLIIVKYPHFFHFTGAHLVYRQFKNIKVETVLTPGPLKFVFLLGFFFFWFGCFFRIRHVRVCGLCVGLMKPVHIPELTSQKGSRYEWYIELLRVSGQVVQSVWFVDPLLFFYLDLRIFCFIESAVI